MLLTAAELEAWIGLAAIDPYGEPLGTIAEVLSDRATGAPEWLLVGGEEGGRGRPVPIDGALPTGRKIRVTATAETVRTAPSLALGEDLGEPEKERLAGHYGLVLDRSSSPSGLLGEGPSAAGDGRAAAGAIGTLPTHSGAADPAIVRLLREAHAMEQASLRLLAAARWRSRDEELVHDLALHHRDTNRHAELLRMRLDELEAARLRPLDWLAKGLAYLGAQRNRLRSTPEPYDLAAALRFERGERDFYERLRSTAERTGDRGTARIAAAIAADEVAMIATLEGHRLRADPGARRDRDSPFEAPPELAGQSPRS